MKFVLQDVLQDVSNVELVRNLAKSTSVDAETLEFVRKNVRVEKCSSRVYEFFVETKRKGTVKRTVERRSYTIDIPGVRRRHYDSYKSIREAVVRSREIIRQENIRQENIRRDNIRRESQGKIVYWMYQSLQDLRDLQDQREDEDMCSKVVYALKQRTLQCPFDADGRPVADAIIADIFWKAPELAEMIVEISRM